MKTHEIVPGLHVRGYPGNLAPETKREAVASLGLARVVALYGPPDPDFLRLLPGGYLHHPIPDGRRIDPALVWIAKDLAACLRAGAGAVLVHCHAGRNRAGLLAALAVRELRDLTGPQALDAVRAVRPSAVANPAFEHFLLSLGRPS